MISIRSFTKWRHAPSITPVAIGHPFGSAVGVVEVGALVEQVVGSTVGLGALLVGEPEAGGLAADRLGISDPRRSRWQDSARARTAGGGHSYMAQQAGATRVVAVEANRPTPTWAMAACSPSSPSAQKPS